MAIQPRTGSARIRAGLNHPVIDTDGHVIEFLPLFKDYLCEVGGRAMLEDFDRLGMGDSLEQDTPWHRLTPEARRDQRCWRPVWWIKPTRNTLDRATAMLPALLRERMDELGLDFTILYPTAGLIFTRLDDEALRRAACRALNRMHADIYREHAARMTPVAVIPTHDPGEALEELDYAVGELDFKAMMISGNVRRPVPLVAREAPRMARHALWMDHLALDSDHDYDPLWARCAELKVAVTSHGNVHGLGSRTSLSSYVFNHIGKFAAAGEAFCKALFLGGVTRRFPGLNFAFLEGGVAWARTLHSDLVSHWEKRNRESLDRIDPANLEQKVLLDLFERYGSRLIEGRQEQLAEIIAGYARDIEDPATLDEWAAAGIRRVEDIHDQFVHNFYFGCEADDPANAWAFQGGPPLKAMFGSDLGHWDVPDMNQVLEEAFELVERGLISEEDFRDFVFANPVSLHGDMNPDFFRGTAVEDAAAAQLAAKGGSD